ncbi:MAG: MMPL family transporter, partial [Acidimicrobiales bacterium]
MALRWILVPGWILGAAAAYHWLPNYGQAASGASQIVSLRTPALLVEEREAATFGFPITSQAVLVQHARTGRLSTAVQEGVIRLALQIDGNRRAHPGGLVGAVPVLDTSRAFPTSRRPGSTALTFLYFEPSTSPYAVQQVIDHLVRTHLSQPGDDYVGATGLYPAEQSQGDLISGSLRLVEVAALGVVFLVVGLAFRSIVAPLVVLLAVGIAYVVSGHVLAYSAQHLGFTLPGELEPLIVILVVGVVTDYAVFFLSAQRALLLRGRKTTPAAREGAAGVMPLVFVAGLTVAAGTATLLVAPLLLYRQLGPGMGISVAVSVAVALTFVPAAVAIAGRALFWPGQPRPSGGDLRPRRRRAIRMAMRPPLAAVVLVAGLAGLGAGASRMSQLRLGLNLVSDLPSSSAVVRATNAAQQGFAPGVVAPSVLVVRGPTGRSGALGRLQLELSRQPGVGGVIGPANDPASVRSLGVFVAPDHRAARYVLILGSPPLGAPAIGTFDGLERHMPSLLAGAGLAGDRAARTGGT